MDSRTQKTPADAFRLIVESVKDYGIFMLDPHGVVLSWNSGAERIKGFSAEEVVGRNFEIFYTEEDRARKHPQAELEIAHREGRYEEEGWRVRKDGTRFWANIVITRLLDDQGNVIGFGKVTRDLTERKKNEDQLRDIKEALERRVAERTADLEQAVRARDEFLSIASHELRTPVTPLKLQLQSLLLYLRKGTLQGLTEERLKKMAGTIDRSLVRLDKLIGSLLDVARINAGKIELNPEDLDVVEVLGELCTRFQQEAKNAGVDMSFDLQGPLAAFLDRTRLEQVVVNLVVNAIKYGNKKPIKVSATPSGDRVVIQVHDQGIGISKENLPRIFNRFERMSKDVASGLGLGLYIAKQIVDAQHGTIQVESELGKGSMFTVILPLKNQ